MGRGLRVWHGPPLTAQQNYHRGLVPNTLPPSQLYPEHGGPLELILAFSTGTWAERSAGRIHSMVSTSMSLTTSLPAAPRRPLHALYDQRHQPVSLQTHRWRRRSHVPHADHAPSVAPTSSPPSEARRTAPRQCARYIRYISVSSDPQLIYMYM